MDFQERPIPERFHSEYLEGPFRTCTRCGESLEAFEDGYHIGKVFNGEECVFEHALCHPCHQSLLEQMSVESRRRLVAFNEERLRLNLGLERCATCGTAIGEGCEHSVGGLFCGEFMLHGLAVCGACSEESSRLLSKETRDVWDRYVGENFPGLPADALPDPGRLVMV